MKHYIIIKFNESVTDKSSIIPEIKALFAPAAEMPGIRRVDFYTSCMNLPNRYDFMMILDLERDALAVFDNSSIHRIWKEKYGQLLESKTIFDCEG